MTSEFPPFGEGSSTEFNIGVDVEEVGRFASASDDVNMAALFTAEERAYCSDMSDRGARYAGTWCAKEAAVKALWPWARLNPRRIAVSRANDGRPVVTVSGRGPAEFGVALRVSISHSGSVATAVALAWGPAPAGRDADGT